MAKNSVNEWDTTDSNNEDIGGVGILGTALPSNLDNAMRKFMAQIATQFGKVNCKGADIASAATVDLAGATGNYVRITGTAAIADFGTLPGGQVFVLRFDDALTLTHDATSLVLPGGADITTAAGDIALIVSEGSGNWRCVGYQRAAAKPGGKATDIASASTVDLAAANGSVVDITGTTTIAGLGTVAGGQVFVLQFDDILTLTHDAISLKLPGAANITTAAGDIAVVVSEGAGNWRCVSYTRAVNAPVVVKTQAWEQISAGAVTSNLQVTDLSAYRQIRISGQLTPATDGVSLNLRTDTNNGASYDAGASDYAWQTAIANASTASAVEDTADTEINITGSTSTGNAAGEGVSFDLLLTEFNQASYMYLTGTFTLVNPSGGMFTGTVAGRRLNAAARDALLLFFSSGNASGFVTVEGARG